MEKVYKVVSILPYMAKKKADALKPGDKIQIAQESITVKTVEISDIGKQGTKKVRVEATKSSGESVVLIRPADYPFDIL